METIKIKREWKPKHTDVFHKLALLFQVMSEGVESVSKYYFDTNLEYILSLKGKSQEELTQERKRFEKLLHY